MLQPFRDATMRLWKQGSGGQDELAESIKSTDVPHQFFISVKYDSSVCLCRGYEGSAY